MQKSTLIIGNWKMHKTIQESCAFVKHLVSLDPSPQGILGLAVPFTNLWPLYQQLQSLAPSIRLGAQNVSEYLEGPYTGEVSAGMLADCNVDFSLVGHSERRQHFHESQAMINRKIKQLLHYNIQAVLCIGESQTQFDLGQTEAVLKEQILGGLEGLTSHQMQQIVVAYEPVWAIGTGKVASVEMARQRHLFIQQVLTQKWGEACARQIPILYGGSVKPENAAQLLQEPTIDGFLVGGASLDPTSFQQILNKVRS